MNVYELVEKASGEIVNGRARVRQGDKYIIVGRVTPEGMVMTADGKTLVDELAKPAKKPAPRKPKAKVEDEAEAESTEE